MHCIFSSISALGFCEIIVTINGSNIYLVPILIAKIVFDFVFIESVIQENELKCLYIMFSINYNIWTVKFVYINLYVSLRFFIRPVFIVSLVIYMSLNFNC